MKQKTDWASLDRLDGELDGHYNNVELAALKAMLAVESRGDGLLPSGKPKILFEGHQFYRRLKKAGINPENYRSGNEDILYPRWTRKHYKGGEAEYGRLHRAIAINREIALQCASYGIAQVMGFNFRVCGYDDVEAFVSDMSEHDKQVAAFFAYLDGTGIWKDLRNKNWHEVARKYNGPAYKKHNYHGKLARAYRQFSQDPQEEFTPMRKSRTVQGGVVAGGASLGGLITIFNQVQEGLNQVSEVTQTATEITHSTADAVTGLTGTVSTMQSNMNTVLLIAVIMGGLSLAGTAYQLYARWDDRRKGYK